MSVGKVGKPLLFQIPGDLEKAIKKYFSKCKNNKRTVITKTGQILQIKDPLIPTIAGLAYALGVDRHTIYNYEERQEYFHTIKKARDYIFSLLENGLVNEDVNQTGRIFIMKNYGYTDKREVDQNNTGDINHHVIIERVKPKMNANKTD